MVLKNHLMGLIFLLSFLLGFVHPSTSDAQIVLPDFADVSNWNLQGQATSADNRLRLTHTSWNLRGSAWNKTPQNVQKGWEVAFQFSMHSKGGNSQLVRYENGQTYLDQGGDGIAFVIQTESDSSLGAIGGHIGYGGITRSLAIEFDTWANQERGEYNMNHASIQSMREYGNYPWYPGELAYNGNLGVKLDDGATHTVTIRYVPGNLTVYLDRCDIPILQAFLFIEDWVPLNNGKAFIGFTSATGSAYETHDIHNLKFLSYPRSDTTNLGSDTLCLGDSITLSAPSPLGPWEWSNGETSKSITVHQGGSYTVTTPREDEFQIACERSGSVSVKMFVIEDSEPITFGDKDMRYTCPGTSVRIDLDPTAFSHYEWSNGSSGASVLLPKGIYTVKGYTPRGCVISSDTLEIREYVLPLVRVMVTDTISCKGDTFLLSLDRPLRNIVWSTGEGGPGIRVDSGSYWAMGLDQSGCIVYTDTVTLRYHPTVTPKVTYDALDFCLGDTAEFRVHVPGSLQVQWSNGHIGDTLRVTDEGVYFATVIDSNGCLWTSDSVQARFRQSLPITIVPLTDSVRCQGDSILLTVTPLSSGPFLWSTGEVDDTIKVSSSGSFWVRQNREGNCLPSADSIQVTIRDFAVAPIIHCGVDTLRVDIIEGGSYLWFKDGALVDSGSTFVPSLDGQYQILYTDSNGCQDWSNVVTWKSFYAMFSDTTADMDSIVTIPLTIKGDGDSALVTFRYLSRSMFPHWDKGMIEGKYRIHSVMVPLENGAGVLPLKWTALLGDSLTSSLDIIGLEVYGSDGCYTVRLQDGSITLPPDCLPPSTRIEFAWISQIENAYPNPSTGPLTISYIVGGEHSAAYALHLYSMNGDLVKVLVPLSDTPEGRLTYYLQEDLPSGRYVLSLVYIQFRFTKILDTFPFVIIR